MFYCGANSACQDPGMTNPEPVCRIPLETKERRHLGAYRLVRNLCAAVLTNGYEPTPGLMLGAARIRPVADDADRESVPAAGPVLVAIGAPYGVIEALAASTLLGDLRPDVKTLADPFVATAPGLASRFLAHNPWERRTANPANVQAAHRAMRWLRSGGLLAAFMDEDGWNAAVRVARLARASVMPAAVVRKHTTMAGTGSVELRIGAPLLAARLASFARDAEAIGYLRWRTNLLAWRHQPAPRLVPRIECIGAGTRP